MDADWTIMLCDVARTQQDLRGHWLPNGVLRVSDLRAQSARSTPASNCGNLGTIETVMQLLTLTDDQRQQLQQTTAQVAQIQSLLQTPIASHINAATTSTASTATPPPSNPPASSGNALLTHLLNSQTAPPTPLPVRRQFNVNA